MNPDLKLKSMPKIRWIAKYQRWQMDAMNKGKRKTFTSKEKSKRKAEADIRTAYYAWLASGDVSNIKFIMAWECFIEDYESRNRESSTDKISERGNAYLIPRFESRKLAELTRKDWQAVIDDEFNKKQLAKKTLQGIECTIRTFLTFCAAKGWISDSDVPRSLLIPASAKTKQKRALYPKELQELMSPDIDKEQWYIPHFRFLVLTGIRRGELCALQTARDYISPYITVKESLSQRRLTLTPPKNGKPRTERLNALAEEAIKAHLAYRNQAGFDKDKHLFVSSTGHRLNPKVLSEAWRTYRTAHGLGDITLHELRHTYATYTDKTLSIEELKEMMGHSESMDTKGVYVHDVPLTKKEIEEKIKIDTERAERIESVFKTVFDG